MSTVVTRMPLHPPTSCETSYGDTPTSSGEMIAQKIAGFLPRRSMSRSILSTFGIEYNSSAVTDVTNPLACLSRAASNIMKRACSPSSYFSRSRSRQRAEPAVNLAVRQRFSVPLDRRTTAPECQENTPPCIKRPGSRMVDVTPILERLSIVAGASTTSVATNRPSVPPSEPRLLRSGTPTVSRSLETIPPLERLSLGASESKSNSDSSGNPKRRADALSTTQKGLLASSAEYYQYHYDSPPRKIRAACSAQAMIEVPSWRLEEDDEVLSSAKLFRARKTAIAGATSCISRQNRQTSRRPTFSKSSSSKTPSRRSSGVTRGRVEDRDEEQEDTSDAAYAARHARLEYEEKQRERMSARQIAEEEFRLRMEQREKQSWLKRRPTRVDYMADINPDKFMPTHFDQPIQNARRIRVSDEIPIIAFGVRVPRPNFGPFSLR